MVAGLAGAGQLRWGGWVGFVTLPGMRGAVQQAVPPVTHTALSPVRSARYIEWGQLVHCMGLLCSVTDTHSVVSGFGGPGQRALYFFSGFGDPGVKWSTPSARYYFRANGRHSAFSFGPRTMRKTIELQNNSMQYTICIGESNVAQLRHLGGFCPAIIHPKKGALCAHFNGVPLA